MTTIICRAPPKDEPSAAEKAETNLLDDFLHMQAPGRFRLLREARQIRETEDRKLIQILRN